MRRCAPTDRASDPRVEQHNPVVVGECREEEICKRLRESNVVLVEQRYLLRWIGTVMWVVGVSVVWQCASGHGCGSGWLVVVE